MTAFFDSGDRERIQLALNILNYPQHFCLKLANQQHLTRLLPESAGVRRLVATLRTVQEELAPHLPLAVDSVWRQRDALPPSSVPKTVCNRTGLPEEGKRELARALDRGLLEAVVDRVAVSGEGGGEQVGLGLALACVWLSQHLALVAIGVAKVDLDGNNDLVITPACPAKAKHLRRLWFGSAFEEMSLLTAHASLEVCALLASGSPHLRGDLDDAFAHALAVIPQHWRLPVDEGPVTKLFQRHIAPLIQLVVVAFQAAILRGSRPVFEADLPPGPVFRQLFADVLQVQRELPPMDRLFDVQSDGLVLGPRKVAPGLLLMAEQIAARRLGPDWHNKQLSDVQKRYLIQRLMRTAKVDVLDIEIRQHDTTHQIHVDVDLFVRDRQHCTLFAVQLKHFEYSKKGGIRNWLERFRPDKLSYGVAQLEAIGALAKSDPKVRTKLLASGVGIEELARIVPVVLHNIGALDCLVFQAGVLVYDQHTFVNVLDGRPAVGVGAINGEAVHPNIPGSRSSCRLDDPDSVISAYVGDPHFAAISHFDAAAETTRRLDVLGVTLIADGLGV